MRLQDDRKKENLLLTPVKPPTDENCSPEKLIATPVFENNFTDMYSSDYEQCESACSKKFSDYCKNANRSRLDSSTQTIDFVALDHNNWYTPKMKNATLQKCMLIT